MHGSRFLVSASLLFAAFSFQPGIIAQPVLAEPAADTEKQAFNAAKELGTVEAWDAFLSNYNSGFYSDLARAYVNKLAAAPAPASAGQAQNCTRHEVYSSSMKQCIPKQLMCEKNEVYSSSLASCMPKM